MLALMVVLPYAARAQAVHPVPETTGVAWQLVVDGEEASLEPAAASLDSLEAVVEQAVRDVRRRGTPAGVGEGQKLDEVVAYGRRGGLDDVDLAPAHRLLDLDRQLTVRIPAHGARAERHADVPGDGPGQVWVGGSGEKGNAVHGLHL